jgi:hypothetical protein
VHDWPVQRLVVIAFALTLVACHGGPPSWTGDSGIYGTYGHFGNPPSGGPTFLCGVAYDLRYGGSEPLDRVDIAVRYPRVYADVASALGTPDASGWWHPFGVVVSGPGSLADAARLGHAAGSAGGICPHGAADLDSLRGTIIRVLWTTRVGSHDDYLTVDDVRGDVRFSAGTLTADGQPRDGQLRIEWRDQRQPWLPLIAIGVGAVATAGAIEWLRRRAATKGSAG